MIQIYLRTCLIFLSITFYSPSLLEAINYRAFTPQAYAAKTLPKKDRRYIFNDDKYLYQLSVCTIFKNDAPYLREWLEYHLLLGVEHFYLYNNMSTDNYLEVLQPYIDTDVVTLVDWPNQNEETWGTMIHAWVFTTQVTAYKDALSKYQGVTKWLAIIDTDEFIVPVIDKNIINFLKKYQKKYVGISIFWQVYGTSNVYSIPDGKLMIEMLMLKLNGQEKNLNIHTKGIVRPEYVLDFKWPPHSFIYKNDKQAYEPPVNEMRVNHYMNRTVDFFLNYKVKNKEKMDNRKIGEEELQMMMQIGNDVEDRVMDRFIPHLKARMHF